MHVWRTESCFGTQQIGRDCVVWCRGWDVNNSWGGKCNTSVYVNYNFQTILSKCFSVICSSDLNSLRGLQSNIVIFFA